MNSGALIGYTHPAPLVS